MTTGVLLYKLKMDGIEELQKSLELFRQGIDALMVAVPSIVHRHATAQFTLHEATQRLEVMEDRLQEKLNLLEIWEKSISDDIKRLRSNVTRLLEHLDINGIKLERNANNKKYSESSDSTDIESPSPWNVPVKLTKEEERECTNGFTCSTPARSSPDRPVACMLNRALVQAAHDGNENEIGKLLAEGADVNTTVEGLMPLAIASKYGHVRCVLILLDAGADLHGEDGGGYTALHHAASRGNMEVLKVLISRGINVNAKSHDGISACTLAYDSGYKKCCSLLLENGANLADI